MAESKPIDKPDAKPAREEGGIRDLVDRAIEWLADVIAPAPVPVPVPVRVPQGRRPNPRRR